MQQFVLNRLKDYLVNQNQLMEVVSNNELFQKYLADYKKVFDVKNKDPSINTWTDIKNFLLYLVYNFSLKNFDFLSCRLDKNNSYCYIFKKFN